VWPEYDRTAPLVIYRAELEPGTTFPQDVTFQLPGYLESMHAVAVENEGSLFSVAEEDIEMLYEGGALLLTFPATTPVVYFEYYDAEILTVQGEERQLNFDFSAANTIGRAIFQLQEPLETQNLQMTPPANNSFTADNGLTYQRLTKTDLAPGDTFEINATYQRSTNVPSVQLAGGSTISEHAEDAPQPEINVITETEASAGTAVNIGYIFIGTGVVLLLGVGGYWLITSKREQEPAAKQPRPGPRKRPAANEDKKEAKATPVKEAPAGFCYKCGTPLRADSNFCHKCGAERRQD
jgi:hypothetical protein